MRTLSTIIGLVTCLLGTSCVSNEQFEQRMDDRNDAYRSYNERRNTRLDARQERTDMWFDRVMH